MDCDGFVLSIKTQNKFNDPENLEDVFDFSNLISHFNVVS